MPPVDDRADGAREVRLLYRGAQALLAGDGQGWQAMLETGMEITTPFYVGPGDRVTVDTRTGDVLRRT